MFVREGASGTFSQLGLRTAKKQYIKADSRQLAPPIERGEREQRAKLRLDGRARIERNSWKTTSPADGRDATAPGDESCEARRRRTEGYPSGTAQQRPSRVPGRRDCSVHHAFPV